MEKIKFTEEFLEDFFSHSAIEDEDLFNCLKGREGTIEETDESFSNDDNHMMLRINLMMKDL